jgi:hypothetical protein
MEARRAIRGSSISKNMVAAFATVLAALMLAAIGGYLVKTLSPASVMPAAQILAGQSGADGIGSAWNYSVRHSGTQSVGEPAPSDTQTSSSFREPTPGRSGPQS